MLAAAQILAIGYSTIANAEQSGVDKNQYHLFNPTPRNLMRPLSADRPDATESPITVDAGHVQVELSFIDYAHDDEDGVTTDATTLFDTNIKIGLLNQVDLQVVLAAYREEETDPDPPDTAPSTTLNGFGDIQLRLKINLWGNDDGETAFAVMPFVKIPTGREVSNDKAEGGFIWMLGWDVAEAWGLGFQIEIDFVFDEVDDGYDTEFLHTVVWGFDVVKALGAYLEYVGVSSSDADQDYQALLSTGVTYEVNENIVLDLGAQFGLTSNADDVNVFTGMTVRY